MTISRNALLRGTVGIAISAIAIWILIQSVDIAAAFDVLRTASPAWIAAMLVTTTLVAYLFAIRRRFTQHRQWMTRSYAVALVFFEGRLLGGLLGLDSNVNATMAAIWACLALSMVFAELANSFHDIRMNLRAPVLLRSEREGTPAYSATS